jgi:hypothetical protein
MSSYRIFKRNKFLETSTSFLIVSFFSDSQTRFISFKEFLYLSGLQIKVIKSKSIHACLNNYTPQKYLSSIKTVSTGPLFLIKTSNSKSKFIEILSSLDKKKFLEHKMFALLCYDKGKIYNFENLSVLSKDIYLNFIKTFYSFYINLFILLKFYDIFLINIFILHLNNDK